MLIVALVASAVPAIPMQHVRLVHHRVAALRVDVRRYALEVAAALFEAASARAPVSVVRLRSELLAASFTS